VPFVGIDDARTKLVVAGAVVHVKVSVVALAALDVSWATPIGVTGSNPDATVVTAIAPSLTLAEKVPVTVVAL
jgi:hypothetical protein